MKIGDRVYVHGHVDEIRKDTVIIRNDGGYFGTVKSEIVEAQNPADIVNVIRCKNCEHYSADDDETYCDTLGIFGTSPTSYCSFAKRREE